MAQFLRYPVAGVQKPYTVYYIPYGKVITTSAKEVVFVVASLSASNFAQKLLNGFALNFQERSAMGH